MADPRGFMTYERRTAERRPVRLRVQDWREVEEPFGRAATSEQAARCMGCGIPFCHHGCPLGNLIPEWNDLAHRGEWHQASERLLATNNFPDFTGRLCPAPCEPACVLGINAAPVAIKQTEHEIADVAGEEGWLRPHPPAVRTGRSVAIIGSGPAGLAAAQQLTRAGHHVVVFERSDRIGGLLRYGIPEFKMEKRVLERRLEQLRAEGTVFRTGVEVGVDIAADRLRAEMDAVVLAGGATVPRDLRVPGRELVGIHQAMEYLPLANRVQQGDLAASPITAAGKHVVIIGGGDTGADCLGTAHRQGAVSVHQLEIMPRPPAERDPGTPWPTWPLMLRSSAAHEEGCERLFALQTDRFLDDGSGRVAGLVAHQVRASAGGGSLSLEAVPGTEVEVRAELVLLAMGFVGAERSAMLEQLGVDLDARANVARDQSYRTNVDGVFTCGDMARGQSLIVWAIAEGRSAAREVDRYLMGRSALPSPLPEAGTRAMAVAG